MIWIDPATKCRENEDNKSESPLFSVAGRGNKTLLPVSDGRFPVKSLDFNIRIALGAD